METCQEKIISLELQDPITNTTIDEQQMTAAAALIQPTTTMSPSDDENSSIITVRSNGSGSTATGAAVAAAATIANVLQLHLAADDDDDNDTDHPVSNIDKTGVVGSFISATRSEQLQQVSPVDATHAMQTIVEVVNPLITGEGHAYRIAIGHTSDPTYPSFDASDNGNVADDEYDSFNAYNPSHELSLNDKMKNVLQELVTNERVRLSFSQSINEDDGDESDEVDHDDTDDDEHEPLQLDEFDGASAEPSQESNGNIGTAEVIARVISTLPAATIDTIDAINTETITIASNDGNVATNKDIENANVVVEQQHTYDAVLDVDDNIVYENPNFLAASCEIDETSRRLQTNERNEKLKEKLLSELNIDEKRNVIPAAVELVDEVVDVATKVINRECLDENNDDDDDDGPSEATTSTETSSRSTNASKTTASTGASGKRKKRKSKAKKK